MYSEFFWSVFSRIWAEYEPENSEYGHFSRSGFKRKRSNIGKVFLIFTLNLQVIVKHKKIPSCPISQEISQYLQENICVGVSF